MKKLIEALHVIQDECNKHDNGMGYRCEECPLSTDEGKPCEITNLTPDNWKINDEVQKALL